MRKPESKIIDLQTMKKERKALQEEGKKLVFSNGCFDIIHPGHVNCLTFARSQGDALIVGLNSDASVRKNKGTNRPVVPQEERAYVLAALECVDYVIIFDDDEPACIIGEIIPDILVKGEDWAHYVSGRETVENNGGRVVLFPLVDGYSTTNIIEKLSGPDQA